MVAVRRNELGVSRGSGGLRVIKPHPVSTRELRRSQVRVFNSLRNVLIAGTIVTAVLVAFSIGDSVSSSHSASVSSGLTGPTISYIVSAGDSPYSIATKLAPNKSLIASIAKEVEDNLRRSAVMPGSVIQVRI